jgi:hypothetical protein
MACIARRFLFGLGLAAYVDEQAFHVDTLRSMTTHAMDSGINDLAIFVTCGLTNAVK